MTDDLGRVLAGVAEPLRPIVARLRELITETIPDAIEEPDPADGLIGYTFKPGTYKHLVTAIAPHTAHVNLMFAKGVALLDVDVEHLLEGTGKVARHIKLRTPDDVERPGVRELLAAAAELTPRP